MHGGLLGTANVTTPERRARTTRRVTPRMFVTPEARTPAPRAKTRIPATGKPRVSRTVAQTTLRRARASPRALSRSEPQTLATGWKARRTLSITCVSWALLEPRAHPAS